MTAVNNKLFSSPSNNSWRSLLLSTTFLALASASTAGAQIHYQENGSNNFNGHTPDPETPIFHHPSLTITVGALGDGTFSMNASADANISFLNLADGGSGTVNVTQSSFTIGDNLLVGNNNTGTMTVKDSSAVLINNKTYIGTNNGSNGTLTIQNISSFKTTGVTYIGTNSNSSGTVLIENNSEFISDEATLGHNSMSTGNLTVTGIGSKLNIIGSNGLNVGENGEGTLEVKENAAATVSAVTYVGRYADSDGTVLIESGGTLSSNTVRIGSATTSIGRVTVAGTNSKLEITDTIAGLTVGETGHGTLTIRENAAVSVFNNINIGFYGTSNGTVWIESGGRLEGANVRIGAEAGSIAIVTVTGAGSKLEIMGGSSLDLGESGQGTLIIENEGIVTGSAITHIGRNANSNGTMSIKSQGKFTGNDSVTIGTSDNSIGHVTVQGAGSSLTTNTGYLLVAQYGLGTLTIKENATVSVATNIGVGTNNNSNGTVFIESGGTLTGLAINIGHDANSIGNVTVTGTDSKLEVTGLGGLRLAEAGRGTLTIENNARISVSGTTNIGNLADSDGTLDIKNGGTFSSASYVFIGNTANSTGTVSVSGAGSSLVTVGSSDAYVGLSGKGTLIVSDGGDVTSNKKMYVAYYPDSEGTIIIGSEFNASSVAAAGTMTVSELEFGQGLAGLLFNHARLPGANADDFLDFSTDIISGAASPSGGTVHAIAHLSGNTRLTGNNSGFAGDVNVYGGRLAVDSDLGANVVTVENDGELLGSGVINSHVTFTQGALANETGDTLTINGDVTFDADSHVNVTLGGTPTAPGLFNVDGTPSLAGTLNVHDAGGFTYGVYRIFDYTGVLNGAFDDVIGHGNINSSSLTAQYSIAGQVNLLSTHNAEITFWDGGDLTKHNNGAIDGGSGTWDATNHNWTMGDGVMNGPNKPAPSFVVFATKGGDVTVNANQGEISVTGMQFTTDSYVISGDPLTLAASAESIINVGSNAVGDDALVATINSNLSGDTTLVKRGDGTLILGGTNSYTRGTTIAAGTMVGDTSSLKGNIVNNATLVFDQDDDGTYANIISGTGRLIKDGSGILILSGANTYTRGTTIAAGTLVGDTSSLKGDIVNNATLAFNQNNDGTYAGTMTGSGLLMKDGAGSFTLTGDSSAFTGTSSINRGVFFVDQQNGGKLGGNLAIGTNATHQLGNGTKAADLTITGNYINHGTLRIHATPEGADKIIAKGAVDITGAKLDLVLSPNNEALWQAVNGPYTLIEKQSTGAVIGTFATPTLKNLVFLEARIAYDGGATGRDVTLKLERNNTSFTDIAATRNQKSTASAIESLGQSNVIWRAVAGTTNPGTARQGFDAMSGEAHATMHGALIEEQYQLHNIINNRIRASFDAAASRSSPLPIMAYGTDAKPISVAADHAGPSFWANAFGHLGNTGSDGNAAASSRSSGGLLLGADGEFGSMRLGLLGGYSQSSIKVAERNSSAHARNIHAGIYGGVELGNFALRTAGVYTWHDISSQRHVSFQSLNEHLSANYNGSTIQGFGELSYNIDLESVRFEPFANLAHISINTGRFAETGGIAALTGSGRTTNTTFTTLGLRAQHTITTYDLNAKLTGMIGWRHAFGDDTVTGTHAFATGTMFAVSGSPIARNSAVIEAGIDFTLATATTLVIHYNGQIANKSQEHGFRAGFKINF